MTPTMNQMNGTTLVWTQMLAELLNTGATVAPDSAGANWRGRTNFELIGYQTVVNMDIPVIVSPGRALFKKFLVGEAAWICSGDNRVASLRPFAPKNIVDFSDDGVRFFGAYGPRFIEQLSYVTATLARDPASRQAVIQVWREQPRSSKDVPCTMSWQFLLRPDGPLGELQLHCVATMRSSDAWAGWVYDVFNFSMVAAVVALELRTHHQIACKLGHLTFTAGSQHLYKLDEPKVREVLAEPGAKITFAALDLDEFQGAQALIDHLWALARNDGTARHRWLRELFI